jgi:hypothetical protein
MVNSRISIMNRMYKLLTPSTFGGEVTVQRASPLPLTMIFIIPGEEEADGS